MAVTNWAIAAEWLCRPMTMLSILYRFWTVLCAGASGWKVWPGDAVRAFRGLSAIGARADREA